MARPTVLVVDNYDSFVYNLVQYVGTHADVVVRRNDAIDVAGVRALDPDGIVISPGPGAPVDAGISVPVFAELSYPTLGVCLGHQALCAANGADVGYAPDVVHGKPSTVAHDGRGLFAGLPETFEVGRYHSLAIERADLPSSLVETARTIAVQPGDRDRSAGGDELGRSTDRADEKLLTQIGRASLDPDADAEGVLMGVRHRRKPHVGVQFHPESILTDVGETMIETFCERCCTT